MIKVLKHQQAQLCLWSVDVGSSVINFLNHNNLDRCQSIPRVFSSLSKTKWLPNLNSSNGSTNLFSQGSVGVSLNQFSVKSRNKLICPKSTNNFCFCYAVHC